MTEITNLDLMRLIHRVMKKIDELGKKIDKISLKKSSNSLYDRIDEFHPIENDRELEIVSKKILDDEEYKENLRLFIHSKGDSILSQLFEEKYLDNFNITGTNGRRKITELVPFQQIFVYLNKRQGLSQEHVMRLAKLEIERIKNRVRKRIHYVRKTSSPNDVDDTEATNEDSVHSTPGLNQIFISNENVTVEKEEEVSHMEDENYDDDDSDDENDDEKDQENDRIEVSKCLPIKNDEDLEHVTELLRDPRHKETLCSYLQSKGYINITDVFSMEFLMTFNIRGSNGKRSLIDLKPFKDLYVYLRKIDGEDYDFIIKSTVNEFRKMKSRFSKRKQKLETKNTSINVIEENVFLGEQHFIMENYPSSSNIEPGEINVEDSKPSTQEGNAKDEGTTHDDADNFTPIKNHEELQKVSEKMKTNPHYLKRLRIRMVEESEDGRCSLEQIFSSEYLYNITMQRLATLAPYKNIYLYLRRHLGQSLKEIEIDTSKNLQRVRNRIQAKKVTFSVVSGV